MKHYIDLVVVDYGDDASREAILTDLFAYLHAFINTEGAVVALAFPEMSDQDVGFTIRVFSDQAKRLENLLYYTPIRDLLEMESIEASAITATPSTTRYAIYKRNRKAEGGAICTQTFRKKLKRNIAFDSHKIGRKLTREEINAMIARMTKREQPPKITYVSQTNGHTVPIYIERVEVETLVASGRINQFGLSDQIGVAVPIF